MSRFAKYQRLRTAFDRAAQEFAVRGTQDPEGNRLATERYAQRKRKLDDYVRSLVLDLGQQRAREQWR